MQEVFSGVYLQEFPLTGNPLKTINIFVIKSGDEAMIVDTGFNNEELKGCMLNLIKELALDLSKTSLFLTHLHSDHLGLASFLEERGISQIYLSKVDGALNDSSVESDGEFWQKLKADAHKQGLDEDNLMIEEHPGFKNRPDKYFTYTPCNIGDIIRVGDFNFELIDEAGHTPGMLGLYEKDKKILFCGDHILGKITPNITYWGYQLEDSLGTYLKNIEKLKLMDIKFLFSSHRFLVKDITVRIDELKEHHRHRLNEVMNILKENDGITVRNLTALMHWDIKARTWEEFPSSQKWFAAGEAMAHITYLKKRGLVKESVLDNGVLVYSLNKYKYFEFL